MEFLGTFLSPQNSISQGQDRLTKYFYFRPDKYQNPDADIENILTVKSLSSLPARLDQLAEASAYVVDTIQISKKVSDDQVGVNAVSYVATVTYDLLENIKARDQKPSSGGGGSSRPGDDDTPANQPWNQRAIWSFQPRQVTVPLIKAYDDNDNLSCDIVNTAGTQMIAETLKYQLEITYTKNYKSSQSFEDITYACINDDDYDFDFDYRGSFKAGTLLLLPPTYTTQWYQEVDGDDINYQRYYTYTVKMIHDPDGWNKKLLNVGTYAIFNSGKPPEKIWSVTKADQNGSVSNGYPKYMSQSAALAQVAAAQGQKYTVVAQPVTDPLPLNSTGGVKTESITDPANNPYLTKQFRVYPKLSFDSLPFKK